MPSFLSTRGLGRGSSSGFLASRGLGKGQALVLDDPGRADKFWGDPEALRHDQIMQEDEDLIIIGRSFIEIVTWHQH